MVPHLKSPFLNSREEFQSNTVLHCAQKHHLKKYGYLCTFMRVVQKGHPDMMGNTSILTVYFCKIPFLPFSHIFVHPPFLCPSFKEFIPAPFKEVVWYALHFQDTFGIHPSQKQQMQKRVTFPLWNSLGRRHLVLRGLGAHWTHMLTRRRGALWVPLVYHWSTTTTSVPPQPLLWRTVNSNAIVILLTIQ